MKADRCPLCGSTDVYIGFHGVECGEKRNCKNYTKNQAEDIAIRKEKERLAKEEQEKLEEYAEYYEDCWQTVMPFSGLDQQTSDDDSDFDDGYLYPVVDDSASD